MTLTVPTSYTADELAQFMADQIGDEIVGLLGWGSPTPAESSKYKEAIRETMLSYGVTDLSNAIDIRKLRALSRREVWRSVMQYTAGNYRFGSDREQYYRNMVHEQAEKQYSIAATDAAPYQDADPRYNVGTVIFEDSGNPFIWINEDSE